VSKVVPVPVVPVPDAATEKLVDPVAIVVVVGSGGN